MILGKRWQTIVAAAAVTAMTVTLVGFVVLSTTPLGCGPAKAMHMKMSSNRCANVASTIPIPSPLVTGSQAPSPGQPNPTLYPVASSNPYPGPASSNPYPPPASSYPNPDPASSGFPPFSGPASGAGAPAGLALNCRLPIYANGPGSGGFIVFPNGNFIADPRSAVTAPSPSPGPSPAPPQYGGYQGWWGTTYDRAYSRWLPVPYAWVSPDGKRYAYPGQPDGVYVQNITNGTQIEIAEGKSWQVLDLEATGVYAVTGQTGGLWFLSLSGTVTQIASSGYWNAVWGSFAYGAATSQVPQGAGNTILRLNLSNGTVADYFALPSLLSTVQGFDYAGHPVIYVQTPNGPQIWIATAPNVATEIANLQGTNFWIGGVPIADSHGLWFAGGNGIALYVAGRWYFMSNLGGQLAGGCY